MSPGRVRSKRDRWNDGISSGRAARRRSGCRASTATPRPSPTPACGSASSARGGTASATSSASCRWRRWRSSPSATSTRPCSGDAADAGGRAPGFEEDARGRTATTGDAGREGPRSRAHRHPRPLARAADDRGGRGRGRRLRARSRSAWTWSRARPCSPPRASTAGWCRWARSAAAPRTSSRRASEIVRSGRLGKGRVRRDLLLLPHALRPEPARRPAARPTSTTTCGPAPRRCAPTTRSSTRGAGAPSWSTATASSATCASTCSTWSAGCWTSARPGASAAPGGIFVQPGEQGEHHRHPDRDLRLRRPPGGLDPPHLGRASPTRSTPGAPRSTARRAPSRPASSSYDFEPLEGTGAVHRDVTLRARPVPRGPDREGPRAALPPRPSARHMKDLLDVHATAAAGRSPTSSKATSRRPPASWPTSP